MIFWLPHEGKSTGQNYNYKNELLLLQLMAITFVVMMQLCRR